MSSIDPKNFTVISHGREIKALHATQGVTTINFLGMRVPAPVFGAVPMRLKARTIAVDLVNDHEVNGARGKLLVATTEMGDALFFLPEDRLSEIGYNPKDWVSYACNSPTPWGLTLAQFVGLSPKDLA